MPGTFSESMGLEGESRQRRDWKVDPGASQHLKGWARRKTQSRRRSSRQGRKARSLWSPGSPVEEVCHNC